MSHIKKNSVLKAVVFCLVFIFIETLSFSYYHHNGSTGGYDDETQPPGIQCNISMEILVIDGAGFFFQSHEKIQTILNMLELQDIKAIDYIELNCLVESSLIAIINARINFEELIKVAEATPYKLEVIKQLNRFDYDTFLNEYRLNPYIFGVVRDYLIKGDITGTYKHSYANLRGIEQLLLKIQSSISENSMPDLEILWRVNELCAEETLLGSYIARVFKTIK
jgi:hypothetical protein